MSSFITKLDDRAIIEISGPAAGDFLNGIITNDILHMTPDNGLHGALLTPQGKILFDFFVLRRPDGFYLDVNADAASALLQKLTLYKLRQEVELTPSPEPVFAAWGDTAPQASCYIDPRLPEMGWRIIGSTTENSNLQAYHAHRINLGVPDSCDIATNKVFPHEANMDQLAGVSFTKGCYIGQEVVSRMHHRGNARSRMVIAQGNNLKTNAAIIADDREIGTLLSSTPGAAIALVRLDRVGKARAYGSTITSCDHALNLVLPKWANYNFPTPTEKTS